MTEKEIVNRNFNLLAEFMKYAFDNPDILDQILPALELVILPEDAPILYKENIKIAKSYQKRKTPVTIIKMKTPKPVIPRVEVRAA
jgi:hypothetical protein